MKTKLRVEWKQLATPAGDDLDALIAEMMGVEKRPFSTDDCEALMVVGWLRQQGWLVVVRWMPEGFNFMAGNTGSMLPGWRCSAELRWMPLATPEDARRKITGYLVVGHTTMAESVCRVALKAVHAYFR